MSKRKNKKAQLIGTETILWMFRIIVLIVLVAIGTIFIVARYNSIKLDKKPLLASQVIDAALSCFPSLSCVRVDENYYIKIYNDTKKFDKGNSNLEELCELKQRGVKLEYDVYCSYFKTIKNNLVYSGLVVVK